MAQKQPSEQQQRVPLAYCVEMSRLVNIIDAKNFYFSQAEPRQKLSFVCADEKCNIKIAGANYWKLVSQCKQRPHFRAPFKHKEGCEYTIERAAEADAKGTNHLGEYRKKDSLLIDVFLIDGEDEHRLERGQPGTGFWKIKDLGSDRQDRINDRKVELRSGQNRSGFLGEVVSSYWELTLEQRRNTRLELRGAGSIHKTTYEKAFRRITDYADREPTIFWAGAYVQKNETGFRLWFYDKLDLGDGQDPRKPYLSIPVKLLNDYRFRSLLENQLLEVSLSRNRYVQAYFLGQIKRTLKGGLQISVKNFDHLALVEKEKKRSKTPKTMAAAAASGGTDLFGRTSKKETRTVQVRPENKAFIELSQSEQAHSEKEQRITAPHYESLDQLLDREDNREKATDSRMSEEGPQEKSPLQPANPSREKNPFRRAWKILKGWLD